MSSSEVCKACTHAHTPAGHQRRDVPGQLMPSSAWPPSPATGSASAQAPQALPTGRTAGPCARPAGGDSVLLPRPPRAPGWAPGPRLHGKRKSELALAQPSLPLRPSPLPPCSTLPTRLYTPARILTCPPFIQLHTPANTWPKAPSQGGLRTEATATLRHRPRAEQRLDPGLRRDGCPPWTPGVEDTAPRLQPHP